LSLFDKQLSAELTKNSRGVRLDLPSAAIFTATRKESFGLRGGVGRSAALARELPAKVWKRIGQLARLGPTGLLKFAYITTLGRPAYAVADVARSLARRSHLDAVGRRDLESWALGLRQRLGLRQPTSLSAGVDAQRTSQKGFGDDRRRFLQVLEGMLNLAQAGCPIPHVLAVDWDANAIVSEFVIGKPFPRYARENGISDEVLVRIEDALLAIHRAGYVLGEIGEKDVVVTAEGRVIVLGLHHLRPLAGLSRDASIYRRDIDRRRFNELFGTRLLTAAQLRRNDSLPGAEDRADRAYAAVAIRGDIHWGQIWNTDLGIARWNYILKDHLPIPQGGRILDLGSNLGLNPLQMLRHGASSAIGIEMAGLPVRQSGVLKAAYEWLDNRSYDFRCIQDSFADLPSFQLGRFDVVTALCALYYLSEREMRDIVKYIRTISDVLVTQCNTDRLIRRASEETYRKATVEFAVEVLGDAGFARHEIIAPRGYSRPLVMGYAV
jgi:hypothetical protein